MRVRSSRVALALALAVAGATGGFAIPDVHAATCSTTGVCRACKNCKYCNACSKQGKTCSVCRGGQSSDHGHAHRSALR